MGKAVSFRISFAEPIASEINAAISANSSSSSIGISALQRQHQSSFM